MKPRTKYIAGGTLAVVIGASAAGIGIAAASGGDDDTPLTGTTLDQAVTAALETTGGGTVTETEMGDDGAAYSVEVRFDDGTQVEVNLDSDFNVIGQENDDDGPGDTDEPGDD
jgi:uncharacterized membrane protein YkoI